LHFPTQISILLSPKERDIALVMPDAQNSRGLYRFAVATAFCTVLLLMAGALVTSNNAAESVPDWPLAYGKLIPPMIGGIRFEYAHRVAAAIVATLTLILAILVAAKEPRPLAKRLGWTALALVIAQALLGGFRVLVGMPALSATAHAILAQIFFITIVGLAMYLSPWWQSDLPQVEDTTGARQLMLWTTFVIFGQLILGAAFRHGAFGIKPHLYGAGIVTFMVIFAARTAKMQFREIREMRKRIVLLHATFGIQILLGGAAWGAVIHAANESQPSLLYVTLTVAHVLGGALTLAASVILTLSCYRLIGPGVSHLAASTPHGASLANSSGSASA
jgi:cytochrome c oxidase assembly protein subunit 15